MSLYLRGLLCVQKNNLALRLSENYPSPKRFLKCLYIRLSSSPYTCKLPRGPPQKSEAGELQCDEVSIINRLTMSHSQQAAMLHQSVVNLLRFFSAAHFPSKAQVHIRRAG